jgi:lysophospholipase L1-like esterase
MSHARFFTEVKDSTVFQKCDFSHTFGFIGSCFSDHIFDKFKYHGLDAWKSPFGTTYNPLSIAFQLDSLINLTNKFSFFNANADFFSWETAHQLRADTANDLDVLLNTLRRENNAYLLKTDVLFITLGTATAFELASSGKVVANCHKQPASLFKKVFLTIEEMYQAFVELVSNLKKVQPQLKIVLTVSPVRHLRSGLVENSRSKARLMDLCHRLIELKDVDYLPVYEWVIDELRDYRFYEADGVHPNGQAIDFVSEKLFDLFFEKETRNAFKEIEAYRKMQQHRPISNFNPIEFERFEKKMEEKKREIEKKFSVKW